jgi:deoxycytidylate deaminase
MTSPFQAMQAAVDIVNSSQHPTNKIAATLFHTEQGWSLSSTNHWPTLIDEKIGRDTRIGNSSGTVHAETDCLFQAAFHHNYATQGASLCVTDPFCPNCAKNMAEAGIENIYIDHKGFIKDFALRRGDHFENMSMRIAEKAGVNVYEINRKDQSITPICHAARDYHPANEKPVHIDMCNSPQPFTPENRHIKEAEILFPDIKFSLAYGLNTTNILFCIVAPAHPAIGFNSQHDIYEIAHPQGKYSFIQEPSNRLLMTAVKKGLKIKDNAIYTTDVPTSREFVNLIGADIQSITISNKTLARDDFSLQAMSLLQNKSIITVR